MRCEGALQIQRLEGSLPGGLWDLYLDEPVLIDCKFAIAVSMAKYYDFDSDYLIEKEALVRHYEVYPPASPTSNVQES